MKKKKQKKQQDVLKDVLKDVARELQAVINSYGFEASGEIHLIELISYKGYPMGYVKFSLLSDAKTRRFIPWEKA